MADKLGRFNVIIFITALTAIITLGLWIPGKSEGAIVAYAILFGFSSGGMIGIAPTLIAQISDIRQIGSRVGSSFGVQSFAALIGSPIAGAIVTAQNGSFLGLQIFCGCSFVASGLFYFAARTKLVGLDFKKKV